MAIEFFLPLITSIIQGGLAQGISAHQATSERNEQMRLARRRREELQPIIDRLREPGNYFNMEEAMVRNFSRGADQMAAQSAQTGMTGAGRGGLDQVRGDLLGAMIAEMTEAQQQQEMQKQQMLVELLSDPLLYAGQGQMGSPGGAGLLAGLGGGLAGASGILSQFLSSEEGLNVLRGLGGDKATTAQADAPDVSWMWGDMMNAAGTRGATAAAPARTGRTYGYGDGAPAFFSAAR